MTTIDSAMRNRLRGAAQEVIAEHRVPGVAIAVVAPDGAPLIETAGVADIESATPLAPAHRHCIASVTKTMVGLSIMALVDEGRLSIDDRLVDLLPDATFHGPAESVRLRHLLSHTSGIGEAPTVSALAETVNPQQRPPSAPVRAFAEAYPEGVTIEADPRTKWAYANNGYVLLGEVLQRTEGEPLDDVLRRRIFGTLGMMDSDCVGAPDSALSAGYHRPPTDDAAELMRRAGMEPRPEPTVDGTNIRGAYQPDFGRLNLGAGGVRSTIGDMARYAQALLRGGEGIVRPATLEAMVAPEWCPDERLVSWGLSFSRARKCGYDTFGHGGAYFGGWNTLLTVVPDADVAIVTFINVMLDEPAPVFNRILRAALDAQAPALPDDAVEPALLEQAPGVYELTMPGPLTNFRPSLRFGRVQLSARDGKLVVHARRGALKHGATLHPADPADPAFLAARTASGELAHIALERDARGRVTGLRTDELVRMVRTEQVAPWA